MKRSTPGQLRATIPPAHRDAVVRYRQESSGDAADLKKTLTEITQQQVVFQEMIEHSLQAAVIIQDRRIVYVNRAFESITGYTRARLLAMSQPEIIAIIHPNDREQIRELWARMERELKVPDRVQFQFSRSTGENRWVEMRLGTTQYQGRPAIQNFLIDITERRQLDHLSEQARMRLVRLVHARTAALRKANQKMSAELARRKFAERLLRIQRDLAGTLGRTSDMADASEAIMSACLGIGEVDSGGIYLADPLAGSLSLVIHRGLSQKFVRQVGHIPADSEQARMARQGLIRFLDFRQIPHVRAQQQEGLRALAVIPVKSGGRVVAVMNLASHKIAQFSPEVRATLQAIAAQVGAILLRIQAREALLRSQILYRTLADNTPDMIYLLNRKGNVVFANRLAAERLRRSQAALTGAKQVELFKKAQAQRHLRVIRRIVRTGRPHYGESLDQIGGQATWLDNRLVPVRNEAGKFEMVLGISRDINDRKAAEQELIYRETFEQLILDISTQFINLAPAEVDPAIEAALGRIAQFLDVDRAHLAMFSPDRTAFTMTHQWDAKAGRRPFQAFVDTPVAGTPWSSGRILRGQPVILGRIADYPAAAAAEKRIAGAMGNRSLLLLPMWLSKRVVGCLGLISTRRDVIWNETAQTLLKVACEIFSTAIERKRTETELIYRETFEQLILDISTQFINLAPAEVDPAIESALGRIALFLKVDRAMVAIYSDDQTRYTIKYTWDARGGRPFEKYADYPVSVTPWSSTRLLRGEPVIVSRLDDYPPEAKQELKLSQATGNRSVLLFPMKMEKKVIGCLGLFATRRHVQWSKIDQNLLTILCEILAGALNRQRLAEDQRRLSLRLLEIQETERREISAALHDHLGQVLTLARLEVDTLKGRHPADADLVARVDQRIAEALASTRRLARSLRPTILDDLGLEPALRDLADEFQGATQIRVHFTTGGDCSKLPPAQASCFYRVVQEALTNITRHAQARRVRVRMTCDAGGAEVEVADDGRGFDPNARRQGIGLLGMRERLAQFGGSLDIRTPAGGGTRLTARIPPAARAGRKPA